MQHVKVPKNINLFYSKKNNYLICKHKDNCKLIKLKLKLLTIESKKQLLITKIYTVKLANKQKKTLSFVQKLTFYQIKETFLELIGKYYQKIKFVGVGYRAVKINQINEKPIFLLKLGISHSLYLSTNINSDVNLFCLKFTKLFIFGSSYKELSQTTANIRLKKWPEPYKGKGILFDNEKVKLKEGKKV